MVGEEELEGLFLEGDFAADEILDDKVIRGVGGGECVPVRVVRVIGGTHCNYSGSGIVDG